jgi:uncharacterized protein
MLGILIAIIVSWILLYLFERKNIFALGFLPPVTRAREFFIGLILTVALCVAERLLDSSLRSSVLVINDKADSSLILNMLWWDFKSVLTEELIFRGALLYILIKRLGPNKGIMISAAAFGIYHWFSFGIFGNIVPMFFVFIGTGLAGYAWALAFSKTRSIFMPLGMHLGWNFTFNSIFSRGPLGNGLLLTTGGERISDWFSIIGLWVVPVIILLIVKYQIRSASDDLTQNKIENAEAA